MKRLIRKANENNIETIYQQEGEQNSINEETGLPSIDIEMAQRLRNEVREDFQNINTSNMILLDQLNEADVRHDKCPKCKCEPLKRKEGFKICPSCGTIYKILDGKAYVVAE